MTSVQSYYKEPTSIRRQFTVYPYYASGVNTFFTVQNNTLYRAQADLSGVDYVIARDLGTEMAITGIDQNLLNLWTAQEGFADYTTATLLKTGSARKFQVLSMVSGLAGFENPLSEPGINQYPEPTSRLFYTNNFDIANGGSNGNYATGGEAYMDNQNYNGLFNVTGNGGSGIIDGLPPTYTATPINDLLIVGSGNTTILTNTTQNLPFGTFWAMNDPIVIGYQLSGIPLSRAIKNRIDETTLF